MYAKLVYHIHTFLSWFLYGFEEFLLFSGTVCVEMFHLSVYLIINSSVICGHSLLMIVLLACRQSSVNRVEINENKALGEMCPVPKKYIIIFRA